MHSDIISKALDDLHHDVITHTEFLKAVGADSEYRRWCRDRGEKPDEDNATFFFDMHGFEESQEVKEYIEFLD